MGSIIMKSTGTLKFYDSVKGFGFVATKEGDVRIAKDVVGNRVAELVKGADVELAFIHQVHNCKPGFNATRIDSIVAPPPKQVAPQRITLLAIVERFDVKRQGWWVRIPDAGFSAPQAYLSPKVCERVGFIPDPADILRVTVADGAPSPYVTTFSFGAEVDAAWTAQMGDLHAEDIDGEEALVWPDPFGAMFVEPPVDDMLDQYRLDTMRDIGQLPAVAIEEVEEAPVIAAPKKAKPAKPRKAKKPVACSVDSLADLAHLGLPSAALNGSGNGAVVTH